MSSSCSAAPDPAVGVQVSVLRCHSQCDRGMASHHPTAHPSASQYSQSSRGFFPSLPPPLAGLVLQDLSGLLHTQGQSPRARSLQPSAPSSVCFPAGLPGAPGMPLDVARPALGVGQGWGGHRDSQQGPQGQEQPLGCPSVPTLTGGAQGAGKGQTWCQLAPAAPQGFGVCPITVLWVAAVPGESQLCARGGRQALVPGRRRMKAAAPQGKRLRQVPCSHLLQHQLQVPSSPRAACPGCPPLKDDKKAAELRRTLLK